MIDIEYFKKKPLVICVFFFFLVIYPIHLHIYWMN